MRLGIFMKLHAIPRPAEILRENVFDRSSKRYGRILIWLTFVPAVLTAVLVCLTILLVRHA